MSHFCNCDAIPLGRSSASTVELTISDEAKCGPTQHDYASAVVQTWGNDETVLFCRNCGDVRKLAVPS